MAAASVRPRSEPVTFTLWIDGKEIASQSLDPAASASFADDQQELGGKTLDFRTHGQRRRALGGGVGPAPVRGAAGELQRPQPLDPPAVCAGPSSGRRGTTRRPSGSPRRGSGTTRNGPACARRATRASATSRSAGRTRRRLGRRRQPRRRSSSAVTPAAGTSPAAPTRIVSIAGRARVPAPGAAGRSRTLHRALSDRRASAASRSTKASSSRCRRCWCRPTSCSGSSRTARRPAPRRTT